MAAGAGALILIFAVLSMFNGATFAYVPKSAALIFNNETYTAHKSGTEGLFYSVVKLSREKGAATPAGGETDVERKASGVIVVYNDASAEPQRLIENTRFESSAGKIYRIRNVITIPGKKTVSGVSQPGTIEVTVYADAPGEAYNAGLSDFTVPGLKGTPRYTSIYARSKTPMTGGLVGKEKTVKAEDLARVKAELQGALKDELWQEVQAEVPGDFILFPSLLSYTFEDLPQGAGSGDNVTVNARGNLYGVMFKKSDLAGYLALKKLSVPKTEPVEVPALSSLNLTFAGTPPADLLSVSEINFKIVGNATVLWLTDEVALKADILGRHKRDITAILKNYPTVASASVTVRPFWKSTLPAESDKVSIKKLSAQ
ncbi:MAG: hypothetical protein UY54_C0005G0012 [Parcubacteria group bacterium GW2011_GWA2_50_10b]|nr:MAG: hypothetical protein UY54_C0005G0012 [Parcubacteria group bacterium GW2011_GWA2_50_10b]